MMSIAGTGSKNLALLDFTDAVELQHPSTANRYWP